MRHPSPYELALGENLELLHPRLRAYFSAIPIGAVGRGTGTFDVVGTPRRWLWPLLRLAGRGGALFAVWEYSVPFEVLNRPGGSTSAPSVSAERQFRFTARTETMRDRITVIDDGLLRDELGTGAALSADFAVTVADGELRLRSTAIRLGFGGLRLRLPPALSPVIRLSERFDDDSELQEVSLTADLPVVGRLYEYSGRFAYAIADDTTIPSTPPHGAAHD